ncbi:MAG TPA: DUF2179 domain-containing protein [Deltaproteobacteria bacterium]|nr:DUF2179 domain-containing protein [Deltaproteobacteria bacterium]
MWASGYGLTVIDAQGVTGSVKVIVSIIERHDIGPFLNRIKRFNPQAFYSMEDVRFVSERVTPLTDASIGEENLRADLALEKDKVGRIRGAFQCTGGVGIVP